MGSSYKSNNKDNNKKVILVWIEKNVNNRENKNYQNIFLEIDKINLKCFLKCR